MEHFTIRQFDDDTPVTTVPAPLSLSQRLNLEGRYTYVSKGGIAVLAEDNEPETITVWVAEKRRLATIDTVPEDVPFTITSGVLA